MNLSTMTKPQERGGREGLRSDLGLRLLGGVPEPLVVLGADGRVRFANRRAEELFGAAPGALQSSHLRRLLPDFPAADLRGLAGGVEQRARALGGREFLARLEWSPVDTEIGPLIVALVRDISEQAAEARRLKELSIRDGLTGLFNRTHFEAFLSGGEPRLRFPLAIIYADVDDLKGVNDRYGHAEGDALLKRVASVLRSSFREDDLVARIGGDEFAVVLPGAGDEALGAGLARIGEEVWRVSELSSGAEPSISLGGSVAESAERLASALREADLRMYEDKRTRGLGQRGCLA